MHDSQDDMFGVCHTRSLIRCSWNPTGGLCKCTLPARHKNMPHRCMFCGNEFTIPAMYTAHARRTDPETSHEAAAIVTARGLRNSQREILSLFTKYGRMTDKRLIKIAAEHGIKQSDSGIRTRRSELVAQGRVEKKGTTEGPGPRHTIWGLT